MAEVFNGATSTLNSTMTGNAGDFIFPNLPAGEYRIVATQFGYTTAEYGQRFPGGPALTVAVAAGQNLNGIRIAMEPTGAIYGQITDAGGRDVGPVVVRALKASYREDGRRVLTSVKETISNEVGEYRIFWLPAGMYYVLAHDPRLPYGAYFEVTTMNPDGAGSPAVRSSQTARGMSFLEPTPDGMVKPVFFPGTARAAEAAPVELLPGSEVRADVHARTAAAPTIRGVVVDGLTRQPVAGAEIWIEPIGSLGSVIPQMLIRGGFPNRANAVGAFEIPDLIPDLYTINAGGPGGVAQLVLDVPERDVSNVVLELRNAQHVYSIPLRTTLDRQTDRPSEEILSTLRVTAGYVAPGRGSSGAASIDSGGNGVLTNQRPPDSSGSVFLPGDARLYVAPILNHPLLPVPEAPPALQNTYVKSIRLGDRDVLNEGFWFDEEVTGPFDIVIGTNPAAISGFVVDANNQPVAAATVVLVPDRGRGVRLDLYKTATTDLSGRFEMRAIPPGDYKVFSWEYIEPNAWFDADFIGRFEDRGLPVLLDEGTRETVTIPAIPAR